jgi:hypothetical protein
VSGAYSGLNAEQRNNARRLICDAAWLTYNHKGVVHYTQGSQRWEGIDEHLKAWKGEYPHHADCSALATWCLWNGLDHYHLNDIVNGAAWKGGYTGTMLSHGKVVQQLKTVHRGDCVIYGSGNPGKHTAIVVGWKSGVPMVISHGSEAGPYYLPYNYRSDTMSIRRYV